MWKVRKWIKFWWDGLKSEVVDSGCEKLAWVVDGMECGWEEVGEGWGEPSFCS